MHIPIFLLREIERVAPTVAISCSAERPRAAARLPFGTLAAASVPTELKVHLYKRAKRRVYSVGKPPCGSMMALVLALPIFAASHPATIVGECELNFCVRDGNRWTLTPINTNFVEAQDCFFRASFSTQPHLGFSSPNQAGLIWGTLCTLKTEH